MSTLKPTSWSPVIETGNDQVRVGLATGGVDVLGYHGYAASATWLVASPDDAPKPSAAAPDWQGFYAYDRWRPTFFAGTSSETSFFAGPATEAGTPALATRRERQLQAGVIFPIRHARVSHAGSFSIVRAVDEFTLPDDVVTRHRLPLRGAWQTVTAHTYGYSISPEGGVAAGATAEIVRRGFGSFADATVLTADVRGYLPGFAPHHVVALRLGGGSSEGDETVGRTFRLGGDTPALGVADFDSDAFSLLRGFHSNTFAGSHVAIANAEYRFPIARPQRGVGTWPLFLHTIHGALFADAGHAWTRAFDAGAIKTSFGGQLSVDLVAGYFAPFTASVGAAWGHDGSGLVSDRVTAFFHIGRAFGQESGDLRSETEYLGDGLQTVPSPTNQHDPLDRRIRGATALELETAGRGMSEADHRNRRLAADQRVGGQRFEPLSRLSFVEPDVWRRVDFIDVDACRHPRHRRRLELDLDLGGKESGRRLHGDSADALPVASRPGRVDAPGRQGGVEVGFGGVRKIGCRRNLLDRDDTRWYR